MKVDQLYTSCLSEMTYYISDNHEAAIIDPLRDPYPYIRMAEEENAKIKYIFLTHFHADYISGHIDLAIKTGATIVYGPEAEADFDFYCGKDNEEFKIGNITLKLLHTPGHTLESSSFLLIDDKGNMPYVFTGDCLFVGDVGRPDLAVKPGSISKEYLAGLLYDSLQNKILPLPENIIIYPNHGAGSACGKKMGVETFDTLANQKKTNYALNRQMSKEEFIIGVTKGLAPPPQYFPMNAKLNKRHLKDIDDIIYEATTPIPPDKFKQLSENSELLVVDTRSKNDFLEYGSIQGALYIGIEGNFANWVGTIIENINQKIIFISDNEVNVSEIAIRFSRIGFDNVKGYLYGGIANWINYGYDLDKISTISSSDFLTQNIDIPIAEVIDVRSESDYSSGHLDGAINLPLEYLSSHIHSLDKDKHYYLYCFSGYMSLIAGMILVFNGFDYVTNINGAGFPPFASIGGKF